ncbi:MAG: PilZ domain-containing protein [Acidobacteria bacterium]|nr:PilZ domain-containing protein [Acidobacteriota bacterium]
MMDNRRRSERYAPGQTLVGKVKATVPARILDISRHGVQVEVPTALRPAVNCDVTLPLEGRELHLRARISRCSAQGFSSFEDGEKKLIYRAGLEFVDLDARSLEVLESTLDELKAKTSPRLGVPPGIEEARQVRHRGKPLKIKVNADDIRRRIDPEDVS